MAHLHIHIHLNRHKNINTHTHRQTYIHIHIYVHTFTRNDMNIYTYRHIHIYRHTQSQIDIYTHSAYNRKVNGAHRRNPETVVALMPSEVIARRCTHNEIKVCVESVGCNDLQTTDLEILSFCLCCGRVLVSNT